MKTEKEPKASCNAEELSMKSFFLGPQAENNLILEDSLRRVLEKWLSWRADLFPYDGECITTEDQANRAFQDKFKRLGSAMDTVSYHLQKEIPKHSPRYIGHMFSEYSIPGLLGHFLALLYNPNNISKESSKVGVWLEREAIKALSQMAGYPDSSRGHFTSGGTVANFEMLYRAKQLWKKKLLTNSSTTYFHASLGPLNAATAFDTILLEESEYGFMEEMQKRFDKKIRPPVLIVPDSAHYSWKKGVNLVGLGSAHLIRVPLNSGGKMDEKILAEILENCLEKNTPILAVVSVLGTTELGIADSIDGISETLATFCNREKIEIWHHIDAAYGGFFCSMRGSVMVDKSHSNLMAALKCVAKSDSITIDPHKLGYVPYASGCFIAKDPDKYRVVSTTAPYVAFDTLEDPGPFTLEGSRSAAGAIATYLTSETMHFDSEGMGRIILRTMDSTSKLKTQLLESSPNHLIPDYDLTNIICFSIKGSSSQLSQINAHTEKVLRALEEHNRAHPSKAFYVSKTTLGSGHAEMISSFCQKYQVEMDCHSLHLIRCTVMNPFVTSVNSKVDYLSEFCDLIQRLSGD